MFFLAAGVLIWSLNAWRLGPEGDILRRKWAAVRDLPRKTIVFLGNSHVYRQVDPVEVISRLSTSGNQGWQAVNLGLPAMTAGESMFWVRQLVEHSHDKTLLLAYELSLHARIDRRNSKSERFRYWHGFGETRKMIGLDLQGDVAISKKVERIRSHIGAFGDRLLNRSYFRPSRWGQLSEQAASPRNEVLGYRPLSKKEGKSARKRAEELEQHPDLLEKRLEKVRAVQSRRLARRKDVVRNQEFLQDIVLECQKHDIGLVFFVAPGAKPNADFYGGEEEVLGVPVLAFDEIDKHPDLYQLPLWFDAGHLNKKGASQFSRELAEHLERHLPR